MTDRRASVKGFPRGACALPFVAEALACALLAWLASCDDAGMQTVLVAAALWSSSGVMADPLIVVEDGRVVAIHSRREREIPSTARVVDYSACMLAPAFLDIHIHGCAGQDVMQADASGMAAISRFLGVRGTGGFLATTVTAPLEATLRSLERMAAMMRSEQAWLGAVPCGIHLEGPFLSHAKRGVHPPGDLLEPSIAVFDRMMEAAGGRVRLMTLAPELPGAVELARHATQCGVRVSMGHSNATAQEAERLIEAGAISATHTFNAMRALDHREPGIAGVVLTQEALYAELICDGIHVDPRMVRLWWRLKGRQRGILVTDAMAATGMPEGEYQLGGMTVQLTNGRATAHGVLAGSVLTLDRALANLMEFTGESVEHVLPLLTENPAALLNSDAHGRDLRVGQRADIVALSGEGRLIASLMAGVAQR